MVTTTVFIKDSEYGHTDNYRGRVSGATGICTRHKDCKHGTWINDWIVEVTSCVRGQLMRNFLSKEQASGYAYKEHWYSSPFSERHCRR